MRGTPYSRTVGRSFRLPTTLALRPDGPLDILNRCLAALAEELARSILERVVGKLGETGLDRHFALLGLVLVGRAASLTADGARRGHRLRVLDAALMCCAASGRDGGGGGEDTVA